MHPLQFTLGRLVLLIAAIGVALASLQGEHIWFMGISIMTIVGLVGAAIGAEADASRTGRPTPHF